MNPRLLFLLLLAVLLSALAFPATPKADAAHSLACGLESSLRISWRGRPIEVRLPRWFPRREPRCPDEEQPGYDASRPTGYATFSNRIMRIAGDALPLRLYSTDRDAAGSVSQAIDGWNRTARAVGIRSLFAASRTEAGADFVVDWSGRGLSGSTIGMTRMRWGRSRAWVEGVTMRPYDSLGRLAPEVLAHELGHALGLGHSENRRDLMYALAQGYGDVRISPRDRQMVGWLYSQPDYIPIVATRDDAWGSLITSGL